MSDRERLVGYIPLFRSACVVVVGDLFLDQYIVGRAMRLSREAPIPVLEFERQQNVPGGAANPAQNVVALGGQARSVGVVGDDPAGRELAERLRSLGVATDGLVVEAGRPTTTKTRIVSEGSLRFPQQLARIDRLARTPVAGPALAALQAYLASAVSSCTALLLSDYQSGVVTPAVVAHCLALARRRHKLITVDSQGSLDKFRGCDIVKCNQGEAEAAVGFALHDRDEVDRAGALLLERLACRGLVITRGAAGMSVYEAGGAPLHIAAANVTQVYDVTGAGDTVIAVLTLALASGATLADAAALANDAAGLVVRKLGNATTTPEELAAAVGAG